MSLHAQRAPWRAGFGSADARGFFFQAEDGIRDGTVTEVQTCALPISPKQSSDRATGGVRTSEEPSGTVWFQDNCAREDKACRGLSDSVRTPSRGGEPRAKNHSARPALRRVARVPESFPGPPVQPARAEAPRLRNPAS